jgi:hypothetical protein
MNSNKKEMNSCIELIVLSGLLYIDFLIYI